MTKLTITIDLGPHWSESCPAELGLDEPQSDWVALDFETATASRASPCAIGLAHVCGMKVVAVERVLMQPPGNEYDGFNVMIHGIEPEMTADSPTFAEIWPHIHDRLAGKPLVAHNASFDFSVLRHSLDAAGMDYPELNYYCTRVFALRHWPDLPSYALELVADRCGFEFNHHDPGEDARASAEIALRIAAECGAAGPCELAELKEVRPGRLFPGGYYACSYRRPRSGQAWSIGDLRPECGDFDEAHPFFQAEIVFTGALESMQRKEAMQRVLDAGGRPAAGVTRMTDYLVVGDVDLRKLRRGEQLTSKMKKALQLRESGLAIQVLGESDFLQLL
jgi:DNA polymerase-3 subunit epsilon